MDNSYLNETFVSKDFSELFNFMMSLELGSWLAGCFREEDDSPFLTLYNPEEGVVVISRISLSWITDFFDPAEVLENGATVLEVYSHTVEPESDIHEVMRESMDVVLDKKENYG